jgi:hypothetical protein
VLAKLSRAEAEQVEEAQIADRKAVELESARLAARAKTEQSRRREALVRTQIDTLSEQARRLETELDGVALERDVLARERDESRAALAKARTRSSYAVLPHKGPNGTWRRPIVLECQNGQATLQPGGPSFSLLEMSMLLGPRSAPLVAAVAREVMRSQAEESPDGAPVVPYIFFVIRPDGIKPYYNARAQLEPLGIAFGYELVDQNMEIDYPDLANLDEWDSPISPRPGRPATTPPVASAPADRPWPASGARGTGTSRGSNDTLESFVWPARPELAAAGSGGGAHGPGGYGRGGGNETGGGNDLAPGFDDGGQTGRGSLDPGGGTLSPGPYAPGLRNGLGRGGSGVDPLPLGTPLLDPDNPYDNTGPGPGSPTPGSRRGGGRASPSGPGPGPGLVPVGPGGMPSLENPGASGGGSGPAPPDPAAGGGWRAAGRDSSASPGSETTGASSTASAAGGRPVGASDATAKGADPGSAPRGNLDPGLGAPPSLSQLARLAGAGAGGDQGNAGQPSRFQSASPFGLPVPLPGAAGDDSGGAGENDSVQSSSKKATQPQVPRSRSELKKPMTIEVPFEMVVACGPEGVVLHPGGYRLSSKALKGNDALLLRDLKSIVQARRQVDPTIRPRPSIRFLIEPGGAETYRDARRQTVLSGLDWPVSIQIADSDILDNLAPRESF